MSRAEVGERRILIIPPETPHPDEPSLCERAKRIALTSTVCLISTSIFGGMTYFFARMIASDDCPFFCAIPLGIFCSVAVVGGVWALIKHRISSITALVPRS